MAKGYYKLDDENIDQYKQLHVIWGIADVIDRAKERKIKIGKRKAELVLRELNHRHDCNLGITWDTLDFITDDVVGGAL